jgi:hypothetical protein
MAKRSEHARPRRRLSIPASGDVPKNRQVAGFPKRQTGRWRGGGIKSRIAEMSQNCFHRGNRHGSRHVTCKANVWALCKRHIES